MSYTRIWIHLVFSTKNRIPYLTKYIRHSVQKHIYRNCSEKGIIIIAVNGYHDHLHCLIALGKLQTISKIAMLIKGESSHWINKNMPPENRFQWQDGYYAVSVSETDVERVHDYINNQEARHRNKSFEEELNDLRLKNDFNGG